MKNYQKLIVGLSLLCLAACKKDLTDRDFVSTPIDNYSSLSNFYAANEVHIQLFLIDAVAGGSFTTPQGTVVNVPANAFVTQSNQPVAGVVTIQFKDIYKKSDMLLSDMPTMMSYGVPLKSGGEFFIKALSGNSAVEMAPGKKIVIQQPVNNTGILDTAMLPFANLQDTTTQAAAWVMTPLDSLNFFASSYVFSLYEFNSPLDSGSWCNSDNPYAFSAFTQTLFTIHPNEDPMVFTQDVYLVFKNVNSMVHVYCNGTDYPYHYAPIGLQCTVVTISVRDGKLFSSFTPVTIGSNQTVGFTETETTTAAFKTQLESLN
jgi:hypothetical protein